MINEHDYQEEMDFGEATHHGITEKHRIESQAVQGRVKQGDY